MLYIGEPTMHQVGIFGVVEAVCELHIYAQRLHDQPGAHGTRKLHRATGAFTTIPQLDLNR